MKRSIKNFKEFLNENSEEYLDDLEGEFSNKFNDDDDDIAIMEPEEDFDFDDEPGQSYINPDIDQEDEDEDIEIDNRINMFKKEGIPSEFWTDEYEEEESEIEESISWKKVTEDANFDVEEFYDEDEYLTDEERKLLRGTEDNPEGL